MKLKFWFYIDLVLILFNIYTIYKYGSFLQLKFNSFLDIVTVTELRSNTDFIYFFWNFDSLDKLSQFSVIVFFKRNLNYYR